MPYADTNWSPVFSRMQPGGFFLAQDMPQHPGNVWFVNSSHANASDTTGAGRNPNLPFATLDYAISHASVAAGDTFYILPGHAENLAVDSAVDVDVNNLHIVGLGWGGCRPTFTCTAVAGDFKLAASCGILENILFVNGVDNSTGLFEVSSSDWEVRNCEFRETPAVYADYLITVLDGSDRFHFHHNKVIGNAADGSVSAMSIGSSDHIHLHDNYWYGNYDTGVIQFITAPSAAARIHDSTIWQLDDTAGAAGVQMILDTITTSTGIMGPNLNLVGIVDAANITEAITGATFNVVGPIWVNNAVAQQSLQINWTASGD
jgi:hypothetical protein